MKRGLHLIISLLVCSMLYGQGDPQLNYLSTYRTGIFDEGAAEIAAFDPSTARIFFTNADENSVRIINITDPMNPVEVGSIDMSPYGGGINSVDVANGIVAVAVEATEATDNGSIVFFDTDGQFINDVTVGPLPDMLTFTNDGTKVLVANEGEPNDAYDIDPEGAISIIDISNGANSANVSTFSFKGFDDKKASLENKGVRIFGPNASVAEDLEPEYIAVTEDDAFAYVALQENNALAVIDIDNAAILDILPLGYKDHSKGAPVLQEFVLNEVIENWPELGTPDFLGGQPTVNLGGFSGLYFDPTESDEENYVFYTIPDRGPNSAAVSSANVIFPFSQEVVTTNLRPFKLPDYQARIVKFTLNIPTNTVTLSDPILLRRILSNGNETPVTGKGNVPFFDETAVVIAELYSDTTTMYGTVDLVDTVENIGYKELGFDAFGGDFEGILKDGDGNFWLCDEYRPSIYKFDPTGLLLNRYVPDGTGDLTIETLGFSTEGFYGSETLPSVYKKARKNRGFEGLALDTDSGILYAFIQSPIETPDNSVRNNSDVIRILGINPADGQPVAEYIYLLERNRDAGYGLKRTDKIGDAIYIGNGKFLVIERDSSVPDDGTTGHKYIYEIDLKGATNILELPISAKEESSGPDDPTLEMLSADESSYARDTARFQKKSLEPSFDRLSPK